MKMTLLLIASCLLAGPPLGASTQSPAAYVIGVQDVLAVSVFDQPTLSGKYTVEADGTVNLPWIGHIKADGLSVRDFESELKTRLEKGFLRPCQKRESSPRARSSSSGQRRRQGRYCRGKMRTPR
jgi:protein involved in polysaccharide export with SLBB domain